MTTETTQQARDFRGTHTAGRSPEELRDLVSHVGAELELAPAENIIEWAVATFGDRFCITSSMVDAVLADLASKVVPGIDVVFLDTGYHFIETIGTRDAVASTLDVNLLTITPVQSVAEQDAAYGKDLYKTDPDLCCASRKVKPLTESLAEYDAWATGLRRADTHNRVIAPAIGWDAIEAHERALVEHATRRLTAIEGVTVLGRARDRGGVFAFALDNAHSHDLATLLEQGSADGATVRAIVGEDPVEFAEAFLANYPQGSWISKERARLADRIATAIDEAER